MNRAAAVAAAFGVVLAAGTAQAEDMLDRLCADAPDHVVKPLALRDELLAGVPASVLDADDDGTITADEMFAAATNDRFCSEDRIEPCSPAERTRLTKNFNDMAQYWETLPGIEIRRLRLPTREEIAQRPSMLREPWGLALDEKRRFVELRCSTGTPRSGTRARPWGADAGRAGSRLNIGTFVLGKDVDSLTTQRGPVGSAGRLNKVAEAEIGFENDRVAKTRTVSIDGTAGLKLVDGDAATLIPYVQYVRTEVRDRAAGTRKVAGKLGIGAVATAFLGDDQIDVAPVFARDTEHRSELFATRVVWRPGFLYNLPSFRAAWHFACEKAPKGGCKLGSGLAVWTDAELIGSFGTVLRKGNDPRLTDGREFVRAGGLAGIHVYGLDGIVRDLSFDTTYKRLFRLSGDGRDISSFKADVNWWVGGSDNVSLRYGYERSRDEETLERTDAWTLGLGLRF